MVLGSQSPRDGMGRQFMSSAGRRRRRRRTGRWAVIALIIAAVGYLGYTYGPSVLNTPTTARGDNAPADDTTGDATGASRRPPTNEGSPESADGGDSAATSAGGGQNANDAGNAGEVADPGQAPGGSAGGGRAGVSGPSPAGADARSGDTGRADSASDEQPGPEPERLDLAGEPPSPTARQPGGDGSAANGAAGAGRGDAVQAGPGGEHADKIRARARELAGRAAGDGTHTRGMERIAEGAWVEGRRLLSRVLFAGGQTLDQSRLQAIREVLTRVNQLLIFSAKHYEQDPLTGTHTVQPGQYLSTIAPQYDVPYQIVAHINDKQDPGNLRRGEKLKVVKGPFHARIIKHRFILDLYLRNPAGEPVYVRSFAVGLGEENSTPVGNWVVRGGKQGKVKNPGWTNPRTRENYAPDDPDNPIGEYWIPLKGVGPKTKDKTGYGIHGTIEPESIGQAMSMGCIRLRSDDIELLFGMLEGGESSVQIVE